MKEKLKQLGFSEKESIIYLKLAYYNEIDANELAKLTQINRTVVYNILMNLVKDGLVSYIKKDKKRYYKINPVENLHLRIREKEIVTNEIIEEINSIRKKKVDNQEDVTYFEDEAGLKEITRELLEVKSTVYLQNATGLLFDRLKNNMGLLKGIAESNKIKIIANRSFNVDSNLLKEYGVRIKYLKSKKMNYATTYIFKNTVIIQLIKNDRPFIIKIKNKDIFEGYKQNFEFIWDNL